MTSLTHLLGRQYLGKHLQRKRESNKRQSFEAAGRVKQPWQGPPKHEAPPQERTVLMSSRAAPSAATSVWSRVFHPGGRGQCRALGIQRKSQAGTARLEARRPLRPSHESLGTQDRDMHGDGGNEVCKGHSAMAAINSGCDNEGVQDTRPLGPW